MRDERRVGVRGDEPKDGRREVRVKEKKSK